MSLAPMADPLTLSAANGVLAANKGGTGLTSYAIGDLLYADGAESLAKLADIATGNALISGGVGAAPAWGKVGLTTHVSGILPSANGGTGIANTGTLTVPANTSITGGGTLALGGFTLTVPATGAAAVSAAALTNGRIPYATLGGLLTDSSLFTRNADNTITIGNLVAGEWSPNTNFAFFQHSSLAINSGNYALLASTTLTSINTPTGGTGALRVNNASIVTWSATGVVLPITTGTTLTVSSTDAASVSLSGGILLNGATTKTIKYTNGTANAAVATTLGSVGPTGSTAGDPQGWLRVNIGGTDRYIPYW